MAEPYADRAAECEVMLFESAKTAGMVITGDRRVSEADAAKLLGLNPGSLRNMRSEGRAPKARRVGTTRITYRLQDLASWIARHDEEI